MRRKALVIGATSTCLSTTRSEWTVPSFKVLVCPYVAMAVVNGRAGMVHISFRDCVGGGAKGPFPRDCVGGGAEGPFLFGISAFHTTAIVLREDRGERITGQ